MFGHVDSTWVQGIELNEAIRSGEFKMDSIRGYYYDAEKDIQTPALRSFCDEFYARKQNEKDKVRRAGYKFILNSISGKFIQTRKRNMRAYVDVDRMEVSTAADLVAGGLFHPFIAAAITADTRARIHCLEHKYSAIHTATDGIFTLRKPAKDVTYKNATKLGQLTCDGEGTLLLIRNKCYILYGDKGDTPSWAFEGKRILKAATHGYQGSVSQLEKLIASGKRKYTINKPNKLGESIKRGLIPNQFREREMTLKVGPINVIR
jgi:hypothetical protein